MMSAAKPPSGSQPDSGFTLIEVLVAITLLAVVMTVLVGGLRFSARSWSVGLERSEEADEYRAAHRLLRQVLEPSLPEAVSIGGRPAFAFSGRSSDLRFVSHLPESAGVQHPQVIYLRQTANEDGDKELEMAWAPFGGYDAELPEPAKDQRVTLLSGLSSVAFSYIVTERSSDGGRWADTWASSNDLPSLVRIRLAKANGAETTWPDIIVPLRTQAEHDCVLPSDDARRRCRLDAR